MVINVGRIDGPVFRQQRELILRLQLAAEGIAAGRDEPFIFDSHELLLLTGLNNLLDVMADQLHDMYGVDCLIKEETGRG